MTQATTLIFLRHCHTAANVVGEHVPMSGGLTDTDLSSLGEEQASLLPARLGPEVAGLSMYSSPLRRALRTAEALAVAVGSSVQQRPGLREIDCGKLEGLTLSDVKRCYPREWDENMRHENPHFRWPGGESYSEFRRRCLAEVCEIAAVHPGGRVLIVTHAGFISQIVGATVGVSAARWDLFRPGNASITELTWGPDGGTLVRFDDRAHLSPQSRPDEGAVTASATTRPHAG